MLDHMAQGRLNFGVAASGLPSDWAMFNVDGNAGEHREMTREALDIILKLWTEEEPFDYQGKYWKVTKTDLMLRTLRPHIRPFQKPHPPIGVAGRQQGIGHPEARRRARVPADEPQSESELRRQPLGIGRGGRATLRTQPRRADWRLVREIFVADSDAEAWRLSVEGMMGRMMREYFLPLLTDVGVIQFLKHDPDVADSDVTPEYCAIHNWLVGSPATVVEKIERMHDEVRGFGAICCSASITAKIPRLGTSRCGCWPKR